MSALAYRAPAPTAIDSFLLGLSLRLTTLAESRMRRRALSAALAADQGRIMERYRDTASALRAGLLPR
jgi:hypothetical protein